jgi:simple sugar transport system ATP-binding protein
MRVLLKDISKRFGATVANDEITVEFEAGQIHALLGENGAGKTTLVRILAGLAQPDSGSINIDGRPVAIDSPRAALDAGIALVSQHPLVARRLTVFENITAAKTVRHAGLLDLPHLRAEVEEIVGKCGFSLDLDRLVEDIGLNAQKQLEVVRALLGDAKVLIFDEPTDVLNPIESEQFFRLLHRLAAEKRAIILITHFLREALTNCQMITVLRRGHVVATLRAEETNQADLAERMVGALPPITPVTATEQKSGVDVLRVQNVSISEGGRRVVRDVSISVRAGEVVGITGVAGNGQEEVVEAIVGLRAVSSGSITLEGRMVRAGGTRALIRCDAVGYVPPDRHRDGLAAPMSVQDNLTFEVVERPSVSRFGLRLPGASRARALRLVREFGIQPPDPRRLAGMLSGGNQQKAIVGRVVDRRPRLLVVANPSRGLDIGATRWVWDNIRRARSDGHAVVLLSSDLDEVRLLADRILVFFRGAVSGELTPETATSQALGMLMGGSEASHAA